jgi:hypothetical protein
MKNSGRKEKVKGRERLDKEKRKKKEEKRGER